MSSYQYGSTLFNSRRDAIVAMCEDYLTAQGLNDWDSETVQEALAAPKATAAGMTADGWNDLRTVGEYDDDGEQESETIPADDLQDALEEIAQAHLRAAKKYTITVGATLVGETDNRVEAQGFLSLARDMSRRHASHYQEPITLTEDGRAVDLLGSEGFDW